MYIYIKNDIPKNHIELEEKLNHELHDNLGETWEDYLEGKWVLLNEDQFTFLKRNPGISMIEVYNLCIGYKQM